LFDKNNQYGIIIKAQSGYYQTNVALNVAVKIKKVAISFICFSVKSIIKTPLFCNILQIDKISIKTLANR